MRNPARSGNSATRSDARSVNVVHTPIGQFRVLRPHPQAGCGCAVFCAASLPERKYGQPQRHAPSAAADGISIISLRLWTSLTRDSPTWSQYKASHSPRRSPWQNSDSNSGSGPAADEVEDQDDDGYNQKQVN